MLALLSVWIGLLVFLLAVGMALWSPLFHDVTIPIVFYGGAAALTFAGLTLWSLRKASAQEEGVAPRRVQAYVGTGCALAAISIVYVLIATAEVVPRE